MSVGRASPPSRWSPMRSHPPAPPAAPLLPSRWALLAWGALGMALRLAELSSSTSPSAPGPLAALAAAVPAGLTSAFFLAVAVALSRRFTIGPAGLVRALAVHAAAALGLALLGTGAIWAVNVALDTVDGSDRVAQILVRVVGYALVAGMAHAAVYARRFREREVAELRLRADLSEAELRRARAELQVLKLELDPRFLFNALQTVDGEMDRDPGRANTLLVRVGDLLRAALDGVGTDEVTLEEELDFVRAYVEVESARLGERLHVRWDVDDEALDAPVPHRVLQPLLESAAEAGLSAGADAVTVTVSARCPDGVLVLSVEEDGSRPAPGGEPPLLAGAAAVRTRLRQMYRTGAAFAAVALPGGGTRVEIRVPAGGPVAAAPEPLLPHEPVRGAAALAEIQARHPRRERGRVRAALPLAAWFAVCLVIFADTLHGDPLPGGTARSWPQAFLAGTYPAAVWTLFLWVALRQTRRRPIAGRGWARAALHHAAAGALLGALAWGARMAARLVDGTAAAPTLREMMAVVGGNFLVYAALAGTAHALEYARRVRAKEVTDLRLRAELSEAELQRTRAELHLLKLELNPHFLFNALHTVSALLYDDVAHARAVLRRVRQLLEVALDGAGTQEVALEEELAFLHAYLDVEQHRLGDRLRVEWDVDGGVLHARVPHMILQPLVENAVKHGLAGRPAGGTVRVRAAREGSSLVLSVDDDGIGVAPGPRRGAGSRGVGVANTRARLAQLHGRHAGLELRPRPEGGTRAEVRLPFAAADRTLPRILEPAEAHV